MKYDVIYISGQGKQYIYKTFSTFAEAMAFVNEYQETHEHKYILKISENKTEAEK